MTLTNAQIRLGASWSFSLAVHVLLLFSASLLITDEWLTAFTPVDTRDISSPQSIDVKLTLPAQQPKLSDSITYVPKRNAQSDASLRHRTLSDTQFEPRDADYLNAWRQYIESTGTARYKEALKNNPTIKGALTLRVSIDASGALQKILIEKSSGSKALDQLAVNIVKEAAPFQPLPDAMKKDTDTLDILRTWQFN